MTDFTGTPDGDTWFGSSDNETATGNGGNDTLSGGGGNDTIAGGTGADILNGEDGNDTLYSFDISPPFTRPYYGNPWNPPLLDTGIEFDVLSGGVGSDSLFAGYGDSIDGGADFDTLYISFLGAPSGVTADFRQLHNNGSITIGGGTISNIEVLGWIEGSDFDDTITDGDNSANFTPMFGHGGNDRLNGGYYTGDIHGGDGDDIIDRGSSPYGFEHFGEDGNDLLIGSYNGETLDGGDGDDELRGNGGFDTLRGGDGDDLIDPGSDWDHAFGGADDDTFRLSTLSSGSLVSTFDGEAGFDTFDFAIAASALLFETNDSEPNVFYVADNRVQGVEKVIGGSAGDIFSFVYFTDAIEAHGGDGDDRFIGGAAGDIFDGGAASDTVDYGNAAAGVTVTLALLAGGTGSGPGGDQLKNIENIDGSGQDDTLNGSDGANYIQGMAGSDTIGGKGGSDVLDGGAGVDMLDGDGGDDFFFANGDGDTFDGDSGIDMIDYREATGAVTVTLALVAGQIGSGPGGDQISNIENVNGGTNGDTLNGSDEANFLDGMGGGDSLDGKAGNDKLSGGSGEDAMTGGLGNDQFLVHDSGDTVFEAAGEGNDELLASVSYVLAAGQHVERLVLLGNPAALALTGNELANAVVGNGADNALDGGGGSDSLQGGAGQDMMTGGTGDDVYFVDNGGDRAIEAAGGGTDIVYSAVSYSLNDGSEVENLSTISWESTAALNLTGNGLANQLFGNAGANRLDGKSGADTMTGREGNDTYLVDNAGDRVFEFAGGGADVVYASVSYTLTANSDVETLATISFEATNTINLTGNGLANYMIGNDGSNQLDGKAGADVMIGRAGNDKYFVDNAGDKTFENAGGGTDLVYASVSFALTDAQEVESLSTITWELTNAIDLTGNGLNNQLFGNAGMNRLDGRGGNDVLHGKGGADIFAFTTVLGANNVDAIHGFSAVDDLIMLENNGVFVGLSGGALPASAFVIGTAAQDSSDRIIYDQATGRLFFDADGNGAGAQIQFAVLNGAPIIAASDFTVI